MRRKGLLTGMMLVSVAVFLSLVLSVVRASEMDQDAVAVNTAVHTVQDDWEHPGTHVNQTGLDYVALDLDGAVRLRTREGLSETIYAAVRHRDTILDLTDGEMVVGKLIIYNDSVAGWQSQKKHVLIVLSAGMLLQCLLCAAYLWYLERAMIRPFDQLRDFATRVAGGNLDIPLAMDRQNLFGAFTESFDLMRSELKRARLAEAQANESRKELVAKLSHDIRTPVASIRAAAEVGAALTSDARTKENYSQILYKADQISALVNELFSATLEELAQLPVYAVDMESGEVAELLKSADYLHCARIPDLPECLLCADRLRLQQVFDNIFANAYKYAGGGRPSVRDAICRIGVTACREDAFLVVGIEDSGGGVDAKELPLLKEKFWRGSNCGGVEGAGLGLFLSDYFMREMHGELTVANGEHGLLVQVRVPLSGVTD